jgi:glycosyltransferase involved in cell wall biosynthesis
MKRVNIIAWHNGGGLSRDVEILVSALPKNQFEISLNGTPVDQAKIHHRRIVHRATNVSQLIFHRGRLASAAYDINLFLEDIAPGFFKYAHVNAFIPNPEWFKRYQHRYLKGIDAVLCKTQSAQASFEGMGCHCKFISFTSEDRLETTNAGQKQTGFLHLAGRSWQKGTRPLIELWLKHPEWPLLKVVQNAKTYSQSRVETIDAPNIEHILERVDDTRLRDLQNATPVHLCPSEAEGFGHCIAEAMSCRSLTLTTNAPPMNELISTERGILVDYHRACRQRSGQSYFVDPEDLEQKIRQILDMDQAAMELLGDNARTWYEENDLYFRQQLIEVLLEM